MDPESNIISNALWHSENHMVGQGWVKSDNFKIKTINWTLWGTACWNNWTSKGWTSHTSLSQWGKNYFKRLFLNMLDIKYLRLKFVLGMKFYKIGFYVQNRFNGTEVEWITKH
jgi:hypothetical protein